MLMYHKNLSTPLLYWK